MCNRWLLLRFDVLGALSVFAVTCLSLSGAISAGSAGVAITSSQSFVMGCYWLSRFWSQLEMDFNAVERAEEYLDLEQEPAAHIASAVPAYWPSSSSPSFLRVENLSIKYSPELPAVLNDLSFEIKAKEKIGLLGRTGSGTCLANQAPKYRNANAVIQLSQANRRSECVGSGSDIA
jgi:ABC-type multidrug transport system fused ATPase/permease subunit